LLSHLFESKILTEYGFLLDLILILVAVKFAGHVSKRFGQPSVLGELAIGIILGPAVLGWLQPSELIHHLSTIGVILLMFLAGLETDVKEFVKSAYPSTMVAICGVILPWLGGFGVGWLFGYDNHTSVFIGTLLVATSVSISVQTLRELNQLHSKEGVTILGAAVLDDILGIILLSLVLGFASSGESGDSWWAMGWMIAKMALFFVVTLLAGRFILPKMFDRVKHWLSAEAVSALGIVCALAFSFLAEGFGLADIVGAYFAGLMLSLTPYKEELHHKLETVSFSFFVPMFFVSIGLIADIRSMDTDTLALIIILTSIAVVTKWIGGAIGARLAGFSSHRSLAVGAGMIARGEVGLIVATIGLNQKIISPELFTSTVIIVIVTTLITPPLLKLVFAKKPFAKTGLHQEESC